MLLGPTCGGDSGAQGTHVVSQGDAQPQHASHHLLKWVPSVRGSARPLSEMAPNLPHQPGQLSSLGPMPGCDGDSLRGRDLGELNPSSDTLMPSAVPARWGRPWGEVAFKHSLKRSGGRSLHWSLG